MTPNQKQKSTASVSLGSQGSSSHVGPPTPMTPNQKQKSTASVGPPTPMTPKQKLKSPASVGPPTPKNPVITPSHPTPNQKKLKSPASGIKRKNAASKSEDTRTIKRRCSDPPKPRSLTSGAPVKAANGSEEDFQKRNKKLNWDVHGNGHTRVLAEIGRRAVGDHYPLVCGKTKLPVMVDGRMITMAEKAKKKKGQISQDVQLNSHDRPLHSLYEAGVVDYFPIDSTTGKVDTQTPIKRSPAVAKQSNTLHMCYAKLTEVGTRVYHSIKGNLPIPPVTSASFVRPLKVPEGTLAASASGVKDIQNTIEAWDKERSKKDGDPIGGCEGKTHERIISSYYAAWGKANPPDHLKQRPEDYGVFTEYDVEPMTKGDGEHYKPHIRSADVAVLEYVPGGTTIDESQSFRGVKDIEIIETKRLRNYQHARGQVRSKVIKLQKKYGVSVKGSVIFMVRDDNDMRAKEDARSCMQQAKIDIAGLYDLRSGRESFGPFKSWEKTL